MNEKIHRLYYYDDNERKFKEVPELTNAQIISAAQELGEEADQRVFETLPSFEIELTRDRASIDDLRFRLLFKTWAGVVPRQIGVRLL